MDLRRKPWLLPAYLGGGGAASAGVLAGRIWEFDAASLSLTPTHGSGTPTITRAGDTATRVNASGLIEVVNADLPRFDYDPVTLALRGLLVEEARTNVLLQNRDMTNVAWVKGATMTAAKDQTGADGTANGASSLTGGAVLATNTVLQAVVLASSARAPAVWVKRLVGTGTVEMTTDGGTSWVDITSSITSAYSYVSIPTQTLANPSTGFRITTSGDSIAVDYVQNQNGAFITSAIPTTTASVTRAADVITLATASIPGFSASALTMFSEASILGGLTDGVWALNDNTANNRVDHRAAQATGVLVTDGGVQQAGLASGAYTAGVATKVAAAATANSFAASKAGGAAATDTSGTMPSSITQLRIGSLDAGASNTFLNGSIRKLRLYNVRKSDAQLQAMTA